MLTAYLLVKVEGGSNIEKIDHVRKRPEVRDLTLVLGPYDAIVRCEVEDMNGLSKLAREVRACPGVSESVTCLALE